VAVTHFCGPDKAALIQKRRLAAVEIDLSGLARDTLPGELERALLHSAPRQWLWNRHAEAAEAEMRAEAERLAARRAFRRERAVERVARELAAEAAAPPPQDQTATADAVREAELCGAIRTVVAGDGCFAVPREVWQSRLVLRHVLGGIPLDPAAEAASLRPMLQRGFAEPRPGGFEWPEISARWPALRSPSEVLTDYARALGVMGLLKRGADGLWRRTGTGGRGARRALRHDGRPDGVPESLRAPSRR
jgi:hypothetical protein